jgi:hypothetical protein
VSGFFRCLFEHPGFSADDDAHLFEVHPVRAVALGGGAMQAFGVDKPEPASVHSWSSPHNLSDQDGRITVDYQAVTDTLVFTGMDGMDENYVQIEGTINQIRDENRSGCAHACGIDSRRAGQPAFTIPQRSQIHRFKPGRPSPFFDRV